jgi:hypothetical protein
MNAKKILIIQNISSNADSIMAAIFIKLFLCDLYSKDALNIVEMKAIGIGDKITYNSKGLILS